MRDGRGVAGGAATIRGRLAGSAALALLMMPVATAFAATPERPAATSTIKSLSGGWELSDPKTGRKCRLTLSDEAAPHGYALGAPAACRMAVPLLVQATSWTLASEKRIEFVDSAGNAVLSFAQSGAPGHFAVKGGAATYTLVPVGGPKDNRGATVAAALDAKQAAAPAAAAPQAELPPLSPDQVVGTWGLARERYKPVCSIDLLSQKARRAGTFVAKLSGGCIDPGLKVFAPVAWRTERGRLILVAAKGHEQAFAPGKDGVFAKDPPSGPELYMRKQ